MQGYAVRVEPHDGLLAPYDIDGQFRLHRAILDHSDVPMPGLYWLEHDPAVLGMPFFVMERLRGVVPVQWRGNDPAIFPSDEARREIGLQFVDIEARIHGVDWRAAGLDLPGSGGLRPGRLRPLLGRSLGRLLRGLGPRRAAAAALRHRLAALRTSRAPGR